MGGGFATQVGSSICYACIGRMLHHYITGTILCTTNTSSERVSAVAHPLLHYCAIIMGVVRARDADTT